MIETLTYYAPLVLIFGGLLALALVVGAIIVPRS
jgi:hypothetical protein